MQRLLQLFSYAFKIFDFNRRLLQLFAYAPFEGAYKNHLALSSYAQHSLAYCSLLLVCGAWLRVGKKKAHTKEGKTPHPCAKHKIVTTKVTMVPRRGTIMVPRRGTIMVPLRGTIMVPRRGTIMVPLRGTIMRKAHERGRTKANSFGKVKGYNIGLRPVLPSCLLKSSIYKA